MKVKDVIDRVIAGKRISKHREGTYRSAMLAYLRYSENFPTDIGMVNEWLKVMPESWSDETVKQYFLTMRAAGRYMVEIMGHDVNRVPNFYNPFDEVKTPSVRKKERRYLKKDALFDVFKACRGKSEIVLVSACFDASCRIGDLANLKGEDIEFDNFLARKGKEGEHRYYLDSRICEQMKSLAGKDGYVFHYEDGSPVPARYLSDKIRRIMRRSGLTGKKLGSHILRHSAGSMIAKSTHGNVFAVQQKLGHADIKMSERYVHDVEREMSAGVSPMAILAVKPIEQLMIPEHIGDVVDIRDLTDEMFDVIPDGMSVRPLLKYSDLVLIRQLAIGYAKANHGDGRVYESQVLLRRMLRKAK